MGGSGKIAKAVLLDQVKTGKTPRLATPDQRLNRVLGEHRARVPGAHRRTAGYWEKHSVTPNCHENPR